MFSHSSWVGDSKSWVWWTQTSVEQKFLVVWETSLATQEWLNFYFVSCSTHRKKLTLTLLSVWEQQSQGVFVAEMIVPNCSRFPRVYLLTCEIMSQFSALQKLQKIHQKFTPWNCRDVRHQILGALLVSRCYSAFQCRIQCLEGQTKSDLVLQGKVCGLSFNIELMTFLSAIVVEWLDEERELQFTDLCSTWLKLFLHFPPPCACWTLGFCLFFFFWCCFAKQFLYFSSVSVVTDPIHLCLSKTWNLPAMRGNV